MLNPKIVRWGLSNHGGLSGLFAITTLLFDTVGSVSNVQTAEDCFEFCYIGHASLYVGGGTGTAASSASLMFATAALSPLKSERY